MTFEFGYLLDPIGPDQAPGASRFAPADAMTPTPGGSRDRRGGAETSDDADAWLIELLTERAPSATTTTDEDMTWLDEPVAAAPSSLPMPVLETRVDLPPPAALTAPTALTALTALTAPTAPTAPTALIALIAGEAPNPSDVPLAQEGVGSRFATSRTDDDRLPIRRRRRRSQ